MPDSPRSGSFSSRARAGCACLMLIASGCASASGGSVDVDALEESLRRTETAFAQTMADRDLEAFASFLEEGAVFSSPQGTSKGKDAILEEWSRYFEEDTAPFSWRPERVFVSPDGTLGGTTGPVMDAAGNVGGQFVSTWRRQPDGRWKIILDMAPDCR